jgi:hypothetical protein
VVYALLQPHNIRRDCQQPQTYIHPKGEGVARLTVKRIAISLKR